MSTDASNRNAVEGLLADAERALALVNVQDVRGNREIVRDAIVHARQDYVDLVRRSRRMIMTDDEHVALLGVLDHLRAAFRFFHEFA